MTAIFSKSYFSIWLEKPARRTILIFWVAALILLTLMSVMPINVIGPFDARTYEPVKNVRVEYSPAGAALEPVMALAHIIAGAPEMRKAAVSVPIWILVLVTGIVVVGQLHRNHWQPGWHTITSAIAAIGIGVFALALYGMFIILVRIPTWRAVAPYPDVLLVELHTHTFGSHDGLISARDCLRWHRQRGCDVVAVTEHDTPKGSLEASAIAENDESLPPVIPGVELHLENLGYICAIGPKEQLAQHAFTNSQGSFIPWFHQNCHGVVFALTHTFTSGIAERFAKLGIDGFDAASDGHSSLSALLQNEVFAAADNYQLPLVSWTDWHGIGGILRTWTAIRVPSASTLSGQQRAEAVLDALRRHKRSNITPLVIGRMKQVSPARAIFAPFIESMRYALELSPLRLLAWWVWSIALFLFATILLHLGIRPEKLISATAMAVMGVLVLIKGIQLIIAHTCGQAPYFFPVEIGLKASVLGITAVIFGVIGSYFAVIRRTDKML